MKDKTILILTGVGVAVAAAIYYLGGRLVSAVSDINKGTPYEGAGVVGTLGNATNAILGGAPQSLGERLSNWFAPMEYDPGVTYLVIFPDNARHAIEPSAVSAGGYFTYNGVRYRLGINQAGYKVAQRV